MSRAALGIDAAWTPRQPSGVALAVERADGWHLVAAHASFEHFCLGAVGRPRGSAIDVPALLETAERVGGAPVTLVAVDMPLSHVPILGRRVSDNAAASAWGRYRCGTHSPSPDRPGPLGEALRDGFAQAGFGLATGQIRGRALIEVYPHPALVVLTGADCRLPYKISRARKYWPEADRLARRRNLIAVWRGILEALEVVIPGSAAALVPPPADAPTCDMKAFEDRLDAAVCAWVAIMALAGRARPHGDADSAIWIPAPEAAAAAAQ